MRRAPGVAALGISLCLLAGAFGVRALFVPGVGLAALAIGAEIVVRIAAWPVQLTREPRAARVEEGTPLLLTLRVRAGALPVGGGEVCSWPGAPPEPLRRVRRAPIDAGEVAGLAEIVTAEGDLRTLPCHLPHGDPRLGGLDGFYAARLVKS